MEAGGASSKEVLTVISPEITTPGKGKLILHIGTDGFLTPLVSGTTL